MQWLLKVEFSSSGMVLITVTFVLADLRRILVGQRLPTLFSQHDESTYLAKWSTLSGSSSSTFGFSEGSTVPDFLAAYSFASSTFTLFLSLLGLVLFFSLQSSRESSKNFDWLLNHS